MNAPVAQQTGYEGQISIVQFGKGGLYTDAAQSEIPSTNLIRANNCTFYNNILQKDFGSRIWNTSALPSGIIQGREMFTDSQQQNQRIYCLTKSGAIYRFSNYYTSTLVSASGAAPSTLSVGNFCHMVAGGNESAGANKKMFIFTGNSPVQVVSGENTTRTNIATPSADWTGTNQPFGGVIYRGRLGAFGCPNNPHQFYLSLATNHEDFASAGILNFNVYPGEGDMIVCAAVWRGTLWLFKYPLGAYFLVDSDSNSANWYFQKSSDEFGGSSPNGAAVKGDDLIIANNFGSLTSLKAALIYGNVSVSDYFHEMGVRTFAEQEIRPDSIARRSVIHYGYKKQLLTSFQSYLSSSPDRICVMDFKAQNQPAKVSWITKDQPNCLFTVRDLYGIPRPFYGANDGYLYQMDSADRWVGTGDAVTQTGYLFDAQIPHMDLSEGNALIGSQNKSFEFLEIAYEATGNYPLYVDVYLDGQFRETLTFYMNALHSRSSTLGSMPLATAIVDGRNPYYQRQEMHGEARTISLRFYNSGIGQDVRLIKAMIYYRLSGQQQTVG